MSKTRTFVRRFWRAFVWFMKKLLAESDDDAERR